MAAPFDTRMSSSVPQAQFPLYVASQRLNIDSTHYGSTLIFPGSNSDPLYLSERKSYEFSCNIPLPILFEQETKSGKEKDSLKKDDAIKGENDSMNTNSCLAYIPRDKYSGCLILPSGPRSKEIKICGIEHRQGSCIVVKNTTVMEVDSTVQGISCQITQDQDFVIIQTEKTCYLCRLDRDNGGSYNLHLEYFIAQFVEYLSSVKLSPYIPQEACMASRAEDLFIWQEGKLEKVYQNSTSESTVMNAWCNVQFGSHPRCLIYSNQTSVCAYDLRCPSVKIAQLFSKEDLGRDKNDLFRVCQNSSQSSFYHTLATDHCLCLLDERFPKRPILKTNHMLKSVPGYMTEFCNNGVTHVYLGSSKEPIVHQVSWRSCDDYPLQLLGLPYRIPKKSELVELPNIKCKNSKLIMDKLSAPLRGLQTIQHDIGHTVLQLDRNGEVFYQMLEEKRQQSALNMMDEENSVQQDTLNISGAVQHVSAWINKWDTFTKEKIKPDQTMDISTFFSGLVDCLPGFMACRLCMNKISEVLDVNKYSDVICPSCLNSVSEAQALKKAARNDGIVSTEVPTIPGRDPKICESQDKWNGISHLLYDSWYEEAHGTDSLLDKMREDDKG